MDDQEKSDFLFKAMEWVVCPDPGIHTTHIVRDSNGEILKHFRCYDDPTSVDLYDPEFMALAWRVLNWALGYNDKPTSGISGNIRYWLVHSNRYGLALWELPPADAQRLWLDKILELANKRITT